VCNWETGGIFQGPGQEANLLTKNALKDDATLSEPSSDEIIGLDAEKKGNEERGGQSKAANREKKNVGNSRHVNWL